MPRSASRTPVAVAVIALALFLQGAAATSTVGGTSLVFINKPTCCYKCKGCYDKENQERFNDLSAQLETVASWRQAMCKSKGNPCVIVQGPDAAADNKNLVLQPYSQLAFATAGARRYTNLTLTLQRATSLQSLYTALTLVDSSLTLASPHAWLTADNGTLTLDRTTAQGTLRLLRTSFISLDIIASTLALSDTPTSIAYTSFTLLHGIAEFSWTGNPPPAPPAGYSRYVSSYPVVVTNSYMNLTDSILRFINVQDAYIAYSTVRALRSQIVLVNSNVRLFDCTLDLVGQASIELTNSTLLLGKVALKSEVVVLRSKGGLLGAPPLQRKSLNGRGFTLKGSGQLVLGAK